MADTRVRVVLPELGESVAEGSVTRWRKHVGDDVAEGEPLVDVTTDKVDVEIPSPAAGVVATILANEGQSVKVGAPLAEIDTNVADRATLGPTPLRGDSSVADRASRGARQRDASGEADVADRASRGPTVGPVAAQAPSPKGVAASPMVRRLAARRGVDLSGVTGSGPGGRVTPGDVISATNSDGAANVASPAPSPAAPAAPPPPAAPAEPRATAGTQVSLTGAHAALVRAMEESLGIPTATSFRSIAVDVLDARRRQLNEALRAAGQSEKLSFTHLIAFALVDATRAVPVMAESFARTDAGPTRVARGINLGLAVDSRRPDGSRFLVVPVIRNADRLDFRAFLARYDELVNRARRNTLSPDDLAGASLTLTNPGGVGTIASVPRLMAGQGTIVACGAIGFPPGFGHLSEAALAGLGVSRVMTLTSTYDHRIIQGAQSGEFLRRIDELLNGADRFYEAIFENLGLRVPPPTAAAVEPPARATTAAAPSSAGALRAGAAAMALVVRYRTFGHTAADLDPLTKPDGGDPALDPATLGLKRETLAKIPSSAVRVFVPGATMVDVLDNLRATYAGTIAYETEHIANHEQRNWLREQIETGAHRKPLSKERRLALLDSLTRVEAFERYLRRAYLGHKTFSIEGLDALVPMLERAIELFAQDGAKEIDLGMAHRGRLSVITQVVGRPYEEILREFEHADVNPMMNADVTGDVKYHQGAAGVRQLGRAQNVRVSLAPNPSHLEAVDSVVEGTTRSAQTNRKPNIAAVDGKRAVPVLIHGDAAFTGQGVVAEVLNMQSLAGYATGGTLHVIANNQIGFTTPPSDGRSTLYASDLAKGFDVPIIHVNADDVEACVAAADLAAAFRRTFAGDVVIDLIGYRRFGHNETDEPAYTLPLVYEKIKSHKTVREIYARMLVEQGVTTEDDVRARLEAAQASLNAAHEEAKARPEPPQASTVAAGDARQATPNGQPPDTRVKRETLAAFNERLLAVPKGFTIHPKLVRQLERRRHALDGAGEIDWGLAEALAFASLLVDGKPIRLTGQDTERGTFSQRHLGFYDAKTGERWIPLQHLEGARASFEVYNSPLSEYACLGFEYGYSAAAPDALVLWEAQFGDFVNAGQVIVDQFMAAGLAKWQQTSRLVLLLPHGYEGAGPEHSSARFERFLQLAAEGNFRVANCSTPAQYFHLLRDQTLSPRARPLVIMTPKSLLRLAASSSKMQDLTDGRFAPFIDDPAVSDRAAVTRVILCSGKIYYDLAGNAARTAARELAIVRVELLEPFPLDGVLALVASYPNVKRVSWVQEEPKNQGARAFVSRRLRERLTPQGITFDYIGRPDRASTSEGYPGAHNAEQTRIISEALGTTSK